APQCRRARCAGRRGLRSGSSADDGRPRRRRRRVRRCNGRHDRCASARRALRARRRGDGFDRDALPLRHRPADRSATQPRKADAVHREGVQMSNPVGIDSLGYDDTLYILAFDHRGSFEKMVGGDHDKVAGAKRLIWEGFQRAVDDGVPKQSAGILVDSQYGPDVAREAKAGGFKLAMPVEKSGQVEFEFEYGDAFGETIEEFDPDFSKVLVRYNPEGDAEMNKRQIVRLRRLSEWLHERNRKYLFELLV